MNDKKRELEIEKEN